RAPFCGLVQVPRFSKLAGVPETLYVVEQLLERPCASVTVEVSVCAPLVVPAPTVTLPVNVLSPAVASGGTPSSCRTTVPAFTELALSDTARPVLGGPTPGVTEHVAT